VQWLDAVLAQFKPRFVYLDPLVNMRMVWQHAPESSTKRITEEDYNMAAQIQELAVKHKCVVLFTLHGNKRKHVPQGGHFDPFDSVGTTSWLAAGCTGMMVLMDKPGHNPLEEDDDGQRVFSIRTRFRRQGDEHLLLQYGKHSTVSSLGQYRHVMATQRQQELLEIIEDAMDDGAAWVTGATIARAAGISQRAVWGILGRIQAEGGTFNGQRLEASRHRGYRLVDA
jgi:biotin operon repressor